MEAVGVSGLEDGLLLMDSGCQIYVCIISWSPLLGIPVALIRSFYFVVT
jgi:hypothetical protein